MNNPPIPVVACVLLTAQQEILMGLRSDRLEWEVPGGKLDDERLKEAFNRELEEETGILAMGTPQLLGISEPDPNEFAGKRYLIHFMLIREWKGFPQRLEPDKCITWRWFALDELPPLYKCTPGTRDFFSKILPLYMPEGTVITQGVKHEQVFTEVVRGPDDDRPKAG